MAKLDFWRAVQAAIFAVGVAVVFGPVGFLSVASIKIAAVAAGLTLLTQILRKDPEEDHGGGFITAAISPARLVYGRRNPPLDVVCVMDRTNADGDAFRGIVFAISEGPGIRLDEFIKIDGERGYPPPVNIDARDGGLRYLFSDTLQLTIYNRADGNQGAAIRQFSARNQITRNSNSAYANSSDLPGGDSAGTSSDLFSIQSTSAAQAEGAKPHTPVLDTYWEERYGPDDQTEEGPVVAVDLHLYWTSEDPDIDGIQYSIHDRTESGTTWVDADDPGIPNAQLGLIVAGAETRSGEPALDQAVDYRIALRTWRLNAAGIRVYSDAATNDVDAYEDDPIATTKEVTWTKRHKGTGLSYGFLVLRQPADEDFWQSHPNVEVPVRGRAFAWPGQAVGKYTRNVGAVIYDLLRECEEPASAFTNSQWREEIDHSNVELTLTDAERKNLEARGYGNYADGSQTHIRYGCDITVKSTDNISDVLQSLLSVAGEGSLYSWKDKWILGVGRSKAVKQINGAAARITKHDLAEPPIYRPSHPLAQRYNAVRFSLDQSVEDGYESAAIYYEDETARTARDFGRLFLKDVGRMGALTDAVAAHRAAKTILERGRKSMTVSCHLRGTDDLKWLLLQPNDVVELEEDVVAGYAAANLWKGRVDSLTVEPDLSVSVLLLEEDPDIWSDSLILPAFKHRRTVLPSQIPGPVTGLALDEFVRVSRGFPVVYIEATFDDDESGIPVRLRWRITALDGVAIASPRWRIKPFDDPIIEPAIVGATYEVQAQRGYPGGGYTSAWSASATDTVDGPLDPPPALTGLVAAGIVGGYAAQWTDPTVADAASRLDFVEVYDSTDTAKAEPADDDLRRRVPRGLSAVNISHLTDTDERKVWIRPVNVFGNAGDYTTVTVDPLSATAGADGQDGQGVEYVFQVTQTDSQPTSPANSQPYDEPTSPFTDGLSLENPGDYGHRWRRLVPGSPATGTAPTPDWGNWAYDGVVSHWGEQGIAGISGVPGIDGTDGAAGADAAGYEYVFATNDDDTLPSNQRPLNSWGFDAPATVNGKQWFDGAPGVTEAEPVLLRAQRRITGTPADGAAVSDSWTVPTIIGRRGEDGVEGADGEDAHGVEYVFAAFTANAVPANQRPLDSWGFDEPVTVNGLEWHDGAPSLTATDGFLMRAERNITGTPAVGDAVSDLWTEPVVVGRFGQDGDNAPAPPETVVGQFQSPNGFLFSWSEVAGVDGYRINRVALHDSGQTLPQTTVDVGSAILNSGTVGAQTIDALYVHISSKQTVDGIEYVSGLSKMVTISRTNVQLSSPVGNATAGDEQVSLTWNRPANSTGFEVDYKRDDSSTWVRWYTGNNLSTTVTGLTNDVPYDFRIRATATGTVSGYWFAVPAVTPMGASTTAPSVPRNLSATADGENAADSDWDAPSSWGTGSTSSRLYRYRLLQGSTVISTGTTTSTSRTFTGLTADTTYTLSVRAGTDDGNSSYVSDSATTDAANLAWGAWSGSWTDVTAGFGISADVDGADEAANTLKRYAATTANLWPSASSGMFGAYPAGGQTVQTFQQIPSSGNIHRINDGYVNSNADYINPLGSELDNYRGDDGEVWGVNIFMLNDSPVSTDISGTRRALGFIRWQQDAGLSSGLQQAYYVTSSGIFRKLRRYE